MVKYFLKNEKLHKYPLPETCDVQYGNEELYENPPQATAQAACKKCFSNLP